MIVPRLPQRSLRLLCVSGLLASGLGLGTPASAAAVRVWDGGGANAFWGTPANWSKDLLPTAGSDLLFSGAAPLQNTNNLPSGFLCDLITFSGAGYTLRGNAITLIKGINVAPALGTLAMELTVTNQASITLTIGDQSTLHLGGDFNLNNHSLTVEGSGAVDLTGVIRGAGLQSDLIKNGQGRMELHRQNSYAGQTRVREGTLAVSHSGALGIATPLFSDTLVDAAARLTVLPGVHTIREPLQLAGILELQNGRGAPTDWGGTIRLTSNATIEVVAGNTAIVSGHVSGPFGWTKSGAGLLELRNTHTHTGSVTVLDGTLLMNGQLATAGIQLQGGILGGTGVVATITAPGNASKTIAPGIDGPGRLTALRGLRLNSRTTLEMELNGTNVASDFDQLRAGGVVNLGGCRLNLKLGFGPLPGAVFRILEKTDGTPIQNTFNHLPQGAQFTNENAVFVISYIGGTGNDILLTSQGCAGPCNLRVTKMGPTPNLILMAWQAPTLGPPAKQYVVYRDGVEVARLDAALYSVIPRSRIIMQSPLTRIRIKFPQFARTGR